MEVRGQLHIQVTFPPWKESPLRTGYEAGWAPDSVWTRQRREKHPFPAPAGCRSSISQPVIQSLYRLIYSGSLTCYINFMYVDVSKSFRTGRLERKLQMLELSATRCSCIAILWVSLVSFAAITLCVASQRVFVVVSLYFVISESGNFWMRPRMRVR
jgi:hypothetical protein